MTSYRQCLPNNARGISQGIASIVQVHVYLQTVVKQAFHFNSVGVLEATWNSGTAWDYNSRYSF